MIKRELIEFLIHERKFGGKKQWFLQKMVEQCGGFFKKWQNKVPPLSDDVILDEYEL